MTRTLAFRALIAASALAVGTGALAAEEKPKSFAAAVTASTPSSFFTSYLAPRMTARLGDERGAVSRDFASPMANPWTRDLETEDRVRRGAIRATKSALKRYAVDRLNLDAWSLPLALGRAKGQGLAALRTESGGPRLRFGISHMAPRAEVILPAQSGRYTFNADALGRIGASFETTGKNLRAGAYLDPREKTATVGLTFGF